MVLNAKTQSQPTHRRKPQITQINADISRGAESAKLRFNTGEVPAVGRWPVTGGQGNVFDRKRSSTLPCPPVCALRAQASPLLFNQQRRFAHLLHRLTRGGTDAPSARRPVGCMAATGACVRSCRASHRWSAIFRSPAVPPAILDTAHNISDNLFASSRLCGEKPDRWVVSARPRSNLTPSVSRRSSAFICVICGFLARVRLRRRAATP